MSGLPQTPRPPIDRRIVRRRILGVGAAFPLMAAAPRLPAWAAAATGAWAGTLLAQQVGADHLALRREEGQLLLDYGLRIELSRVVLDALERGVPIHFAAQATLREERWYWRDKRVHRASRQWRLAYQPLTASWRVGTGGLNPHFQSLGDALLSLSRGVGWQVADAEVMAQLNPAARHHVEFEFRLDTSQLPGPMQIGLTAQDDWTLVLERRLAVPSVPPPG